MIEAIFELCRTYPQLLIFLAIAIGYFIGKIKFLGFNLGSTAGCLIAALVVGQIGVTIPELLQTVAFALFIFAIGYKVGPQFFGAIRADGLDYIWISLVVAVTGLITALALGKFFGFDPGTTAGLLGGAMTQSAIIGTADGAIAQLPISSILKSTFTSNVAVAYAVTYIFGTAGLVIFFKIVPKLMGIDLKAEAKKLEQELSGGGADSPELFSWYKRVGLRAYKVTNANCVGKTPSQIEAMFPARIALEKIKHGDQVFDAQPNSVIQSGDIVALVGHRQALIEADKIVGPEVDDKAVANIVGEIMNICVLKKDVVGKTLGQLAAKYGQGCFLRRITRGGQELPLGRDLVVRKCDVLEVAGAEKDVEELIKNVGYAERPTSATDLVMVGIAIVLGTLLGLVAVPIFGIPLTLGIGGGVLVAGLVAGWLRAVHPTFGHFPDSAQWIFTDLGLNLFIVCVGLVAGPKAVVAIQTTGLSIFFAGVILTLTPMIVGIIFGRLVLRKLNPVLLFGALTGAGTITAALNALKEEAESAAPALGYTVPYAFGNVLLTVWGTLVVYLM
ncbi:MAG: aspartate-alanine antiporter [Candidatus Saganbacteria bacterium]|nr:aspartate-alanine antiporter [Candidatus Saganbacteria bacterium]